MQVLHKPSAELAAQPASNRHSRKRANRHGPENVVARVAGLHRFEILVTRRSAPTKISSEYTRFSLPGVRTSCRSHDFLYQSMPAPLHKARSSFRKQITPTHQFHLNRLNRSIEKHLQIPNNIQLLCYHKRGLQNFSSRSVRTFIEHYFRNHSCPG